MKKNFIRLLTSSVIMSYGALADTPSVSDVTITHLQDPAALKVSYTISEPGVTTFQVKQDGVPLIHSNLVRTVSGAINLYQPSAGTYEFTWHAGFDMPEALLDDISVEITWWSPVDLPLYCAVYLIKGGDSPPLYWYTSAEDVPFGVNDGRYKLDWLLLRQIPPTGEQGTQMGSPFAEPGRSGGNIETMRTVYLTEPFYIGVYPVTQRQWNNISSNAPAHFTNLQDRDMRALELTSYAEIRENNNSNTNASYSWPQQGYAVNPVSFMGIMRSNVAGLMQFDLPTEMQWEYACRAGTTSAWNIDVPEELLGRFKENGGWANIDGRLIDVGDQEREGKDGDRSVTADIGGTAIVGSYQPNAWGLYDMHGNVYEWCLDWYTDDVTTLATTDSVGPLTDDKDKEGKGVGRLLRGGSHAAVYSNGRSASRYRLPPINKRRCGLRVAAPARLLLD